MFAGIVVYNAVTAPDLFVTAVEYTSASSEKEAASLSSSPLESLPDAAVISRFAAEATVSMEVSSPGEIKAAASDVSDTNKSSAISDSSSSDSALIDINHASAQEMADALPGIGEVIAGRIVDYRNINGAFRSLEELKNVKGIGDKIFDKVKALITVS